MAYAISDLEHITGVSAHNIRIWERRYGALTPSRTAGNTRTYDEGQLKRLLTITSLYHAGYKVSKTSAMSQEEMSELLRQELDRTLPGEQLYSFFVTQLIAEALVFDEKAVNGLIADSFEMNGVVETYRHVIYPLLVRVGLLWLAESLCPGQEHFLSAIIRQKLFASIDRLIPVQKNDGEEWLLFLPEDEDHDIGLLLASYLLRTNGHKVTYLGPKVPLPSLKNTLNIKPCHHLLFFMTRSRPLADAQAYLDHLAHLFPQTSIYLSGNPKVIGELILPLNITWLRSLPELERILEPTPVHL